MKLGEDRDMLRSRPRLCHFKDGGNLSGMAFSYQEGSG